MESGSLEMLSSRQPALVLLTEQAAAAQQSHRGERDRQKEREGREGDT